MLTDCYTEPSALARLSLGVAGGYLDGFTDWLSGQHYAKVTIRSYVPGVVRLLTWAQDVEIPVEALGNRALDAYRKHLAEKGTWRCRAIGSCGYFLAARRFVEFLQEINVVTQEDIPELPLVEEFCCWMRRHRGVAESTLRGYRRVVRQLIDAIGTDPASYHAVALRSFVLERSSRYGRSQTETVVTSVRMFIRFLIATRQCTEKLAHSIPRVAGWRDSSLPRYLDASVIERIVAGCDPTTALGARDSAVILLLARLALRASDVAGLKLQDIDWEQGRLLLAGKSRRESWLPLPQDVGDAILRYLESARPPVPREALFITTRAPYRPILARQVSQTAQRAIVRAGVEAPSYGAHIFRHSAATAMLRRGIALRDIGIVLRHRSIETTTHYAKVDVEMLREVARPWPGVAPC
jgi:site-specific recombinase XerD